MKQNSTKHRILLVLLSVVLLSLGWLGITGFTLLVALIPLLIISENLSDSKRDFWRMFGWAAFTFMLWSASTIWWVWNATPLGPIVAGLVGTFYNLCGFMAYHYTSKRAPRALAYTMLVAVWIAAEWETLEPVSYAISVMNTISVEWDAAMMWQSWAVLLSKQPMQWLCA